MPAGPLRHSPLTFPVLSTSRGVSAGTAARPPLLPRMLRWHIVETYSVLLRTPVAITPPPGAAMAGHDLDHQIAGSGTGPVPGPASCRRPGARIAAPHAARSSPPGWMSRGACRDEDPELFFPIGATGLALVQAALAKAVCGRCPVQPNCLSYALVTGQNDGIWGGTTTEERWPARHLHSSPPAEPGRLR